MADQERPMTEDSSNQERPSPADLDGKAGVFPSPPMVMLLMLGYFGLHLVVRVLLSSSLDLDESEQAAHAQKLLLGYGAAPPLYSWLQYPLFLLFGVGAFPIALLKAVLLSCLCLFTFLNARFITGSAAASASAALALLFAPQISWESQRDLTHTLLASVFATTTLFTFFRLLKCRRVWDYVLFGACAGLGILSKHNFYLWLLGFAVGVGLTREFWPVVRNPRILLSLLVCVLLVLPNGLWMLSHPHKAFHTVSKLELNQDVPLWFALVMSLRNFIVGVGAFAAPVVVILLLLFWGAPPSVSPRKPLSPYGRLALRAFLASAVIIFALFMVVRPMGFRERWFQPVMVITPALTMMFLANRLDRVRFKRVVAAAAVVMAFVLIAIPGRLVVLKWDGPLIYPYDKLAGQLRPLLPDDVFIMGEDNLMAGNLRVTMPDRTILSPELAGLIEPAERHCIIVWDARKRKLPRGELHKWAEAFEPGVLDQREPLFLTAPCKFNSPKQMTIGVLVLR